MGGYQNLTYSYMILERQQQPDYYSKEIEALTSQVKELKETVNILITQITMLRAELKKH
jgi:hypothetical protein